MSIVFIWFMILLLLPIFRIFDGFVVNAILLVVTH